MGVQQPVHQLLDPVALGGEHCLRRAGVADMATVTEHTVIRNLP